MRSEKISLSTAVKTQSFKDYFLNKIKRKELGILIGTQLIMFCSFYILYNFHPYFQEIHFNRMQTLPGRIVIFFMMTILLIQVAYLLYIAYLFLKYKTISSVSDEALPKVTVIVPAYNEGSLVYQTLKSIVNSNYPADKLEIIAVDDGSKDDTWRWICKAGDDLVGNIKLYRQPQNRGKRHALHRGFTTGTGDVFITIDSDSIIEENTIRNLVSPFVVNKKCGAVAGNVRVLNKNEGIIPKMLNVSFVFSFEFIRSAQSSLGFVLCTPGALSAYRREAVLHCLDQWINQKFAGKYATIGEDRAMTNMIISQGYEVKFQKNACVLTNTPTGFKNLHKMFTRWGRSNVRETLMMGKFIFKDFRSANKIGARLIFVNQCLKLLLAIPLTVFMIYFFITHPIFYISSALMSSFIFSSIQMVFFSRQYNFTESLWAYPYSVFYLLALFWITPFSIATVKNGGWLTR